MKRGFLKTDKAKDALHKDSPSEHGRSPPTVYHPIQKPESVPPENRNTEENTNGCVALPLVDEETACGSYLIIYITSSTMKRGFLKTDKAKAALEKDSPSERGRSPPAVSHPIQKPESVLPENRHTEEDSNRCVVIPSSVHTFDHLTAYIQFSATTFSGPPYHVLHRPSQCSSLVRTYVGQEACHISRVAARSKR